MSALESITNTVQKVPPVVWIAGGVGIVGIVAYKAISGTASSGGTATPQSVTPTVSAPSATDNALEAIAGNEAQILSSAGQAQTDTISAVQSLIQSQQQTDAAQFQSEQQILQSGLSQQEQNYAQLQGQTEGFITQQSQALTANEAQTEQYLAQNQTLFASAAQTFQQAQSGMATSLADLWNKLSQINVNPTPTAPVVPLAARTSPTAPPAPSQPATFANPTGGAATYGGQTGAQIQQDFLAAAGGNPELAQQMWENQHALEVARNGG